VCGVVRWQTRRFRWLSGVSADAAGQTRRLWRHGGIGLASSQCTYTILVSITHAMFNRVLYTKKMHLNEMNPFWLSVLSFVWYISSISFESVLNEFVKFIAHGPSFKFSFTSSFSASFHTAPRSLFLSSFFLKFESVIFFESKVWFVIYFNIWISSDYIFKTRSILDTFWKSFSFECEILVKLVSYLTCFYSMLEYNRGFMHIFIGQLFESINHRTTFREQNEKKAILSNLSSHTA
jgi:hypothetical protein